MIMLTTSRTERVHQQKRSAVRNSGRMIFRIAQNHVWRGKIPERFEIGHHRSRVRIESNRFTLVAPKRITRDLQKDFVRKHLLYESARLRCLTWIDESFAADFIASKHSARDLAVALANDAEISVRGLRLRRIMRQ